MKIWNKICNLFSKKKEEPLIPKPNPHVQKMYDWVMGLDEDNILVIKSEYFASKYEYNTRILKTIFHISQKNNLSGDEGCGRRIAVERVETAFINDTTGIPSYKKKDEINCLIYTYVDAKLQKDGTINISKKIKLPIHTNLSSFQQVCLVPKTGYVQVEVIYNKEINDNRLDQTRAIGIDLGLNNLMAITSNIGNISNLVNGRPLKSINQYYNKRKAHLMSLLEKGKLKSSKRLRRLEMKRMMKIKDYLHKTSRRVVELMEQNNIGTCFIGHNKDWKNEVEMGKRNNQNFVSIPYSLLINMLRYKIEEKGGVLVELNEAYTSKCSFLDNEEICKHETYKGKRVKRGLFLSSDKKALNADINGSLNILKRGMKFGFDFKKCFFRPTKIDIQKKLLNFA